MNVAQEMKKAVLWVQGVPGGWLARFPNVFYRDTGEMVFVVGDSLEDCDHRARSVLRRALEENAVFVKQEAMIDGQRAVEIEATLAEVTASDEDGRREA